MQLYPSANIMVADKKDFEPKNRKRFIGRIATGEYDAVVIGHTQFEKIPMSKEYQEKHIQDQIDEIINYVEEYKHDRNQNFTVKQLEKTKKKLETRLEKLNDDFKKDDVGIEIHSGKNRIVRRIFESLGYKVVKLDRVFFAGLTKKGLRRGEWRYLTEQEVNFLRMGSFE